jgi:hypothetical protein
MTGKEVTRLLKPYLTSRWQMSQWKSMELLSIGKIQLAALTHDGQVLATILYRDCSNTLSVMLQPVFDEWWKMMVEMEGDIAAGRNPFDKFLPQNVLSKPSPTPIPGTPAVDEFLRWTQPSLQPSKAAQAAVPAPTPGPSVAERRDCMIVATENLARLSKTACWSSIIAFQSAVEGELEEMGHAMAVWKITPDGPVFAIDADGTVQLRTTSTDAQDIMNALSVNYSVRSAVRCVLYNARFVVEPKKD